jgi:hypothetical protein
MGHLVTQSSNIHNCQVLRRDVRADEWTRFDEYARRVREISFESDAVSQNIYTQLARSRPDTGLFPSLRSVVFPADVLVTTMEPLLISPSLRQIEVPSYFIATTGAANAFHDFLDEVAAKVPLLETLEIRQQMSIMSFIQVPRFKNLQTLYLRSNPSWGVPGPRTFAFHKLISGLATLPHLRELSFKCWYDLPIALPELQGFHRLEILSVEGRASLVSLILDRIVTTSLRSVEFILDNDSVDDLRECIAKIPSRASPSFKIFTCMYSPLSPRPASEYSCLQILAPLLVLHEMTRLDFCVDEVAIPHNDEDSSTIASAFPNLKMLSLNLYNGDVNASELSDVSTPSLQSVESITSLCLKLEMLCVPINDDVIPNPPPSSPLSNKLRSLYLHALNLRDLDTRREQLARFVQGLFPAIKSFHIQCWSLDETFLDLSQMVQDLQT